MKTRLAQLGAVLTAAALTLAGCGGGGGGTGGGDGEQKDSYTIGISQYVSHPSLDATREGFKSAFDEAGIQVEWDEQNAQADSGTNSSIAGSFSTGDYDMVAAIATPSAQAVAQAVTDTPVVFMAVTDPMAAGLVESVDAPGSNVTGVSDMNPVDELIGLVKQIKPDAKTVGVVYSSGEANSKVQVDAAKKAAQSEGLELKESTISASSEVQQGVQALGDVDAIYVPTDNTVVSALESVVAYSQEKKIPIIASDADSVARGAVITKGIDYTAHGKQAGELAVKVLTQGADPASTPVEFAPQDQLAVTVNEDAARAAGVEIPADLLDKAEKVTAADAESGN